MAKKRYVAPVATPIVTVVVVNYNGAHLLPACLSALAAQDMPQGSFEVVVVDNASRDGSSELLEREYGWVRVIANERNEGFAGGNNAALREVQTPFVALLNNDATPERDWLRRILTPYDVSPGARRIGAVTSKIVFMPVFLELTLATKPFLPGGGRDTRELGIRLYEILIDGDDVFDSSIWEHAGYGIEHDGTSRFRWTRPSGSLLIPVPASGAMTLRMRVAADSFKPLEIGWPGGSESVEVGAGLLDVEIEFPPETPRVDVLNNVGGYVNEDGYGGDRAFRTVDRGQYDATEEVFNACGAAVCFRMETLRDAGFFDDDFFLYYEDTDLSWRIRSRGWSIVYEPSAVVRHVHSATSSEWSPLFTFHVERNRLLMLTKNASAGLALWAVGAYLRETMSMGIRFVRSLTRRPRDSVRPLLLRTRVLASYVRLLPGALHKRRVIRKGSRVSRRALQRWLES